MGVLRRVQAVWIWTAKRSLSGETKKRPAYFHNPGTEKLRPITTGQLLNLAAEKWPAKSAIISVHEGKQLTFAQAKEQAEQLGAGFIKLGLKPGDRLGILGGNSIHWYMTMQAAAKAGLILVMLNPAYRPKELSYALKHVGVKGLVTDHKFKTQNYPEMLAEVAPGISTAPHGAPLNCPELPDLSFLIVATEQKLPGCYRYQDIMVSPQEKEIIFEVENQVQPDDPSCIQFTSGTTGEPKAAVLSHFGTINNGYFFGKRCGFDTSNHTICLQVPMFHIFGSTLGILCGLDFGMTLILPGPSFKKEDTIKAIEKHKCDVLYGTPTMHIDVCNDLKKLFPLFPNLHEACKNFKIVISGGALCTPALFEDIYNIFECRVQSAYGLTEASPMCFTNTLNDTYEQRTTTIGCAVEHLEVKIVDKEGKMVNFGESGEAWFRSFGNLLEYWKNEEKTKEAKTTSNWLKSGDLMVLSEDGYATIVGRKKEIIIRGGENIYPSEIEKFLLEHPGILDAQVFGVKDARMGEEVAAAIKLRKSSTLTEKSLKDYYKGKISHFKIPRYIRFVEEYPTTPTGKIKKYELKEMLERELEGQK